jgi:taurine dioxygenase
MSTEAVSTATEMSAITVTPSSPAVGAEISGVDIAAGVTDTQFAAIRQAYSDYGVIFFRDQNLTPEQHLEWAERWSAINVNRFFQPVDGHPQIAEVRKEPDQQLNIGTNWHTDHSYDQIPAMGSILLAREVPESGGDTLFSSQYQAFDTLSDGMKQVLLTMRAEHTSRIAFGGIAPQNDGIKGRIGNPSLALQDAVHPVVIKHPLSGRAALYVNHDFTTNFEGWTVKESEPLLRFLWAHASDPMFTCRFSWEPGSMAIWDNRAVQHRALNYYQGHRRVMHRITLEGEAVGPAA